MTSQWNVNISTLSPNSEKWKTPSASITCDSYHQQPKAGDHISYEANLVLIIEYLCFDIAHANCDSS